MLAKQEYFWRFGQYEIDAKVVCGTGKFNKNKWVGSRGKGDERHAFRRWTFDLFQAAATGAAGTKQVVEHQLVAAADGPGGGEEGSGEPGLSTKPAVGECSHSRPYLYAGTLITPSCIFQGPIMFHKCMSKTAVKTSKIHTNQPQS